MALVLTSVVSNAQFHVGGGVGYSSKMCATGDLAIGYDFKAFDVQAGFVSHISSTVGKGTLFNARLGHTVTINEYWSVQPSVGAVLNYQSNDDKSLNKGSMIYGLSVYKGIYNFPEAQIQFGVVYAQKTTIVSVGLRFSVIN